MARVCDLLPGDLVTQAGEIAVFIARVKHPVWPVLELVIWRLGDGTVSLDALPADQEAGDVRSYGDSLSERQDRLIGAIRGTAA